MPDFGIHGPHGAEGHGPEGPASLALAEKIQNCADEAFFHEVLHSILNSFI
jgi:hypothetical protein